MTKDGSMVRIVHPWGHGPWRTMDNKTNLQNWCKVKKKIWRWDASG